MKIHLNLKVAKENKFGTYEIDYSKILIIEDPNYIGDVSKIIKIIQYNIGKKYSYNSNRNQ